MIKPRKRRKKYDCTKPKSPELRDRALMLAKDRMFGATLRQLAINYGLSTTHVRRIVGGMTPIFNRRPPRRQSYYKPRPERAIRFFEMRQQAYLLRRQGFSYREIEQRTGLSRSSAHEHCRRVVIKELRGRAWLSHELGRPKTWKKQLLNSPKENHHG